MKTVELFKTNIYVEDDFIKNNQIQDIVNYTKDNLNFLDHGLLKGNSTSTYKSNNNIIDDLSKNLSSCKNLIKFFNEKILKCCEEIGISKPLNILNSWINIQNKDGRLARHSHPNSVLSGVLFLKVNDNTNNLYFHNSNPYVFNNNYDEDKNTNFQWFCLKPKNGQLVMWESWLQHSSLEEINNEERIVLSFNANFV
jgi:uncharacterized protein (TIGR02466 family)